MRVLEKVGMSVVATVDDPDVGKVWRCAPHPRRPELVAMSLEAVSDREDPAEQRERGALTPAILLATAGHGSALFMYEP